jgi:hypothetical protein
MQKILLSVSMLFLSSVLQAAHEGLDAQFLLSNTCTILTSVFKSSRVDGHIFISWLNMPEVTRLVRELDDLETVLKSLKERGNVNEELLIDSEIAWYGAFNSLTQSAASDTLVNDLAVFKHNEASDRVEQLRAMLSAEAPSLIRRSLS